jgi:hypothetical protein
MIATGYCPRGPFCAFAHVEAELKNQQRANSASESEFNYESLLMSVLPQSASKETEESLGSNASMTFAGIVLGNANNNSGSREQENKFKNSHVLAEDIGLPVASVANQSKINKFLSEQQQQQKFYAKPIGSEREKPITHQQIQGNYSSENSSSVCSPTLKNSYGGEESVTPISGLGDLNKLDSMIKNQNSSISSESFKTNNRIDTILTSVAMNKSASSVNIVDLEKDKLIQDLKKQTEMSNKLENLCFQYRMVWIFKIYYTTYLC